VALIKREFTANPVKVNFFENYNCYINQWVS